MEFLNEAITDITCERLTNKDTIHRPNKSGHLSNETLLLQWVIEALTVVSILV